MNDNIKVNKTLSMWKNFKNHPSYKFGKYGQLTQQQQTGICISQGSPEKQNQ